MNGLPTGANCHNTLITMLRWLLSRTLDAIHELLRIVDITGKTQVFMLMAKTRVAPIKQVSILQLDYVVQCFIKTID